MTKISIHSAMRVEADTSLPLEEGSSSSSSDADVCPLRCQLSGRRCQPCAAKPASLLSHTAAMSSDMIQQLQRLAHGFSAPCASRPSASALFHEALAFRHTALSSAVQEDGQTAR